MESIGLNGSILLVICRKSIIGIIIEIGMIYIGRLNVIDV